MSGDPQISIVADAGGFIDKLFASFTTLDAAGVEDWALIGGLAVMARLARAHRPTGDVDTLCRDFSAPAKASLIAVSERETETGLLLGDGTKIDIIEVSPDLDIDQLPDDPDLRMFVLAHWWMANTAEWVILSTVPATHGGRITRPGQRIRLARPAALVAAKLQSIPTRKDKTADKRKSDALDAYLLLAADRSDEIPSELVSAPVDLASWCAGYITELFVSQAPTTQRWLADASGGGAAPADFDDIEVVGSLATESIYRHLGEWEKRGH